MIIKRYCLGMYQTNCYLLADEKTKECAVIDPGTVCEELNNDILSSNYDVKYIIFTHGHFDHIGGMEYYMNLYDKSTVLMHKNDVLSVLAEYDVFNVNMLNKEKTVKKITLHDELKEISLGNIILKLIHTPGHSKGSICVYTDGVLFSGDTLFECSVGRTDFIDGNFNELKNSIKELYELPDDTVVYPGHGDFTTIADEKTNNPYVRAE